MSYYTLLKEFGIEPPVPFLDWPGNILTFCETGIALRLNCVEVITPEESRDMFYSKNILEEKSKFVLIKQPCFVMDMKLWKPVILNPIFTKNGMDCVYQVVTIDNRITYSPSEEIDFRKLVGYPDKIGLYGWFKKN